VISEDFEWFLGPDEIGSPVCNHFHDGEQFSVVDIILPFSFCECG